MEKRKSGNQVAILEEVQGLIVPYCAQKNEEKMQIQGQIKWLLDEFA